MSDTLTDKPLTSFTTNTTHKPKTTKTEFKSKILILSTYAADEALSVTDSFSVKPVEVKNLQTPVKFEIQIDDLETPANNMTEVKVECMFLNETDLKWQKLEC